MSERLDEDLRDDLAALGGASRLRSCPPIDSGARIHISVHGERLLSFSSNDYLGLARHPALAAAAATAAQDWGTGASASRLVSGDLPPHRALERALAGWLGRESALVFPSGYQANLGVITALADQRDLIASDALNHASLIDGCRLSRAKIVPYAHASSGDAARALATSGAFRRRFIVTESVFSMDGDVAPLAQLAELATRTGAHLVVDEAHAIGVIGPAGRGAAAAAGAEPAVVIGTLGKALGAGGGFVAGSSTLRATLVNRARTFLFTTALAPPSAAAALAAVDITASAEGDQRRERLHARATQLRAALKLPATLPFPTPIVPYVAGADHDALALAGALRAAGLFLQPIRPPTVPEGTARLRITLSSEHTRDEVARLTRALANATVPSESVV